MGFLKQITGKRVVQKKDRTWRCVAAEKVLKKARTQSPGDYIDRRQATVAEWVTLHPILEVYDKETVYEGGSGSRGGDKQRPESS